MNVRIDYRSIAPDVYHALLAVEKQVENSGLEHSLLDLVKLRASQINGCSYCIDMHWKDARARGEVEQRLYELDAWRETSFYSDRERAALMWTEAVTRLRDGDVPDNIYDQVRHQFSETELVNLTLAVTAINSWNRFAIAFHREAGTYKPAAMADRVK